MMAAIVFDSISFLSMHEFFFFIVAFFLLVYLNNYFFFFIERSYLTAFMYFDYRKVTILCVSTFFFVSIININQSHENTVLR